MGMDKQKLRIFLKSGHTVEVVCEKWEFTVNNLTLEYTGYSFEGLKSPRQLGFVPSQMVGYTAE